MKKFNLSIRKAFNYFNEGEDVQSSGVLQKFLKSFNIRLS